MNSRLLGDPWGCSGRRRWIPNQGKHVTCIGPPTILIMCILSVCHLCSIWYCT